MKAEEEIHEPEVIPGNAVELRRPSVPVTVDELAALQGQRGMEIIQARAQILETARVKSLRVTMPTDWVLFKVRDTEQVYGYLEDQGCDRIAPIWGIQVGNLTDYELIQDTGSSDEYAYRIRGDGHCNLTNQDVFAMEGIRYSTEPYAQDKPAGIQRRVAVQKAARANLDGGITRELAGMKSVPIEELDRAWEGSWKKSSMCHKGRGFGSGAERAGGANSQHGLDASDIPECDVCRIALVWRNGKDGKPGFFGCKNWDKHKETKVIVQLERAKEMAANKRKAAPAETREPGQEG